jgi:hypothetical protein
MTLYTVRLGGAALAACLVLAGCSNRPAGSAPQSVAKAKDKGAAGKPAGHDHADEGPHGGDLAQWGDEEYHLEFTVDHAQRQATVYVYDGNVKRATPIPVQALALTLKRPAVTMSLEARPQDGDPAGTASRFVGTHAALAKDQEFEGAISGQVGGKPYSGDFKQKLHTGQGHQGTPGGADGPPAREVELFLTPGGIYTASDIEKNGKQVPSVKYKGLSWAHDDDVRPGDKMCPVTANKADPQCTWYVNGRKYEFCCPPCLEKFVGWAKNSPDKVKPPEQYVK